MSRSDHIDAKEAITAYLRARKPTSTLAQALVGAVAQLLANDHSGQVTITLPGGIQITRLPKPLTLSTRR